MGDTVFFDVDLASNFKSLLTSNDRILFSAANLKDKILSTADNDFLMVKKKIGSDITILSVDKVDDALIASILR